MGLAASNVWYSHHDSIVWLQPALPDGLGAKLEEAGLASTYEDSGWCYVELVSAAIVKAKQGRLDLSKRKSDANIYRYVADDCERDRMPPIHPEDMKLQLETVKKFTSKGDVCAPQTDVLSLFMNALHTA